MDLWTFWQSVASLRRVEFIMLIMTIVVPVLSGTVVLTLRQRIRILLNQTGETRGAFYHDHVEQLTIKNHALTRELSDAQAQIASYKKITAPRQLSAVQEDILLEKLQGVKAAPVIVAAYAFEDESAHYAAQIAAVLRKAHWDVSVNRASMNDFKGITLGKINLMHQPVAGLRELSQAFADAHLDLRQNEVRPDTIAGQMQDGSLLVVVGRK